MAKPIIFADAAVGFATLNPRYSLSFFDRICAIRKDALPSPHRRTVMPGTVRLHRVLTTKPDKVYRAFLEADAVAKWLPPNGFTCTVHQLEAKAGGIHRMSFRNFTTGASHSFGGKYLELVPGERLRYTDKFDDANLPGEMQVTVTLKPVAVGTELSVTVTCISPGRLASSNLSV